MGYSTEKLCQNARELALQHSLSAGKSRLVYLWKQFDQDIEGLRDFVVSLQNQPAGCSQPAEEWLLDNAEFIEEQALGVKDLFEEQRSLSGLPRLRNDSRLRIQSLCEHYLEQVDGIWDEETVVSYVNAYQEISVLTITETSLVPIFLRIALIRKLAETMDLVRSRREVCMEVERLLSRINPSRVSPEKVNAELEAAGMSAPLSGAWVAHLISHLREWADDSAVVREWLMCKYENGSDDLDRIVSYEHQLQASYQLQAGNLISSLRRNERSDERRLFERISLPDRALRQESSGDYPRLDTSSRNEILKRIEQLARRLRMPESLIAGQSVALAKAAHQTVSGDSGKPEEGGNLLPRSAYAAYYLFERAGVRQLLQALKSCNAPQELKESARVQSGTGAYFSLLIALFAVGLVLGSAWIGGGQRLSPAAWIPVVILLLFPVSEWVITWLHFGIERVCRPRPLLRYDFSDGVPQEAATMVVIPAIWSSREEAQELADRLEVHYLATRDRNVHYALLGDFTDAREEQLPADEDLVAFVQDKIETLNRMYSVPGGTTFHYYQRRRQWNSCEGVYMGWERKRGKLVEFVELLKGSTETSFQYTIGDRSVLPSIRYIITLDADTQLPMGSAQRMIGTMHLPYNRPRLNRTRTRVIEGYGVLQPRIGISHESAVRSRLAYFLSEPGMDPYAFASSDPYQDALGQGIFTGKGIFDVEVFAELLCERIPENRVLSHDLLEGGFMRAALLSDIELIDDHPAKYMVHQKRLHRWIRGDWQLLCWLFANVCDRRGALRPVDLSVLTRWQMIDNLRRSLLPIAYFAVLLLSAAGLPGAPGRWFALVLATMLLPVIRQLIMVPRTRESLRRIRSTVVQVLIEMWTLPFRAVVHLDAIGKTLYRLYISKRHLLEWTSSSHVEKMNSRGRHPALLGIRAGYVLIVLFAAAAVLLNWHSPLFTGAAVLLSLLWASAPFAIRWLDHSLAGEELPLAAEEKKELRELAQRIWSFYEDFAGADDHYLPPDNVQIDPQNGVAHRTSPTNIGFLLTAALAAREFGFIRTPDLVDRLERTIDTVERLDKWKGHLYNWYDTVSLAVLPPAYVSTVDSGNFVASLMTVKQGLEIWLKTDFRTSEQAGTFALSAQVEFAVELDKTRPGEDWPDEWDEAEGGDRSDDRKDGRSQLSESAAHEWQVRGHQLLDRLESLITATDFRALYDDNAKLFVLGYHGASGERDGILYDLLASEARQTSFVAIALGQVSVAHWLALGRTVKKQGNQTTLVSWSGTMFEYMMPWLIMRTYRNTIWDSTYRGVVKRQIEYARERGVPFGISESGYYAFDYQMNYQYRAFGVPGLGFKRGLEQDLVLAPYATIMALPYAKREGLNDLRRMEELGACGQYGFYEAIDFTAARMPQGERCKVIRSFMAHHQGMSLLTLANMLLPVKMYDYFHRDKRVQAAELLLKERIPERSSTRYREISAQIRVQKPKSAPAAQAEEYASADSLAPAVNLHSNGRFTTMVTNTGSGFIRYQGMAVTRWCEDPVADRWGSYMYIRDAERDQVWSPTFQPCRMPSDKQRVQFSQERTTFLNEQDDIKSTLEITVSPESNLELRQLTLHNTGSVTRVIEVTTFFEIALASPDADKAHPAFTKLFVETEYEEAAECLLARKRPRNNGEQSVWAFHALTASEQQVGPVEFETDRAGFIGRGYTIAKPKAIETRLGRTVGSVADPAFIMRRRLTVAPGAKVRLTAVTGVAETKEQALEMVRQHSSEQLVERSFQLAWTRSQIELQHLHATAADLAVFRLLASRVLYTAPLRDEREESIKANTKGQPGLWAYGVSGDRPIMLATISDTSNLSFVKKLLVGFEYMRHYAVPFDLVLLNESPGGYQQELQEALQRITEQIVGRPGADQGGVHLIPSARLSEEDRTLLYAVSRAIVRADGASLRAQLKVSESRLDEAPLAITAQVDRFAPDKPVEPGDYLFYNGYGGFSQDGREYRIVVKNGSYLPAPWINVIANPRFGCIASELNTGYSWWRNSRECKLTPWSNDAVLDEPGEVCYVRDEDSGEYWPVAPGRTRSAAAFKVAHGRGYTRYQVGVNGIQQEMTVFVPLEDPVKIVRLRLHNDSSEPRSLSVTYYAEWVLGVHREGNASFVVTDWDESNGVLLAHNTYQEHFRDATAFLSVQAPPSEDGSAKGGGDDRLSWTGDRLEFMGRNRTFEAPAAMSRPRLSGATGASYDACGAVQAGLRLEPDEERTVYILLGCDSSRESAIGIARKYRDPEACRQAFEEVQHHWDRVLGTVTVSTPSPEMNIMLNNWLLYQTLACRMWARSAFYQAGGAYGFRDQLQDSLALLHSRPELTRAQIVLHASHQYVEGDVQHWWHEETGRGIRTRFSDDLLWLPYATARYIEHTGDYSVLDEVAPFLQSEPLGAEEHERYEQTVVSEESGTIFEHCVRAVERGLRFGEHGLPLIGIGDWNDGMSNVGDEGRGESVWLGWFLGVSLHGMADVCEHRGERERADRYRSAREKLAEALNDASWDGQWYRRAFTDDGQWLGSIQNAECRIDAIAQSWSVISGMATPDKALQAMRSFDRELVDRSLSVAHILYPPFNRTDPSPGYIQGYPPGIRENGGQYTHGVIWSIVAWCMLGEGGKAFELFHMFNPISHTKTAAEVRRYSGEPYAVTADIYTEEPHRGHAGWTWYTGAAGWLYQAGLEWILGLRRQGDRLFIRPCIPAEWPEFSAVYRVGSSTEYRISVKNHSGGQARLTVDGETVEHDSSTGTDGPFVPLRDDGQVHEVVLAL